MITSHLSGCYLQVGLIENIKPENKSFASLRETYQYLFRRNREFALLLWNGIPVRLSYVWDIPWMIEKIIILLDKLTDENELDTETHHHCYFQTKNLKFNWYLEWNSEAIEMDSFWEKIPGNYETALNSLGHIKMMKQEFLYEWKLLLEQLIRAFQDAGGRIYESEQADLFDMLIRINQSIEQRGRYYRTNDHNS